MAELSAAEYKALADLRYHLRRFLRRGNQAAHNAGLRPQQYELMLAIKGMPNGRIPKIMDIAERLQIHHHSAIELVDRLMRRHLVERQRDDADRRVVLLRLTSEGDAILRKVVHSSLVELSTEGPALVKALSKVLRA